MVISTIMIIPEFQRYPKRLLFLVSTVSSAAALDFECSNNPYEEHRHAIQQWRTLAVTIVMADLAVVSKALELAGQGIGHYDALHIASPIAGKADLFVTTDDRLIKKIRKADDLPVMLPGEALAFLENWYEN